MLFFSLVKLKIPLLNVPKLSIIKPNSRNARHCRQNLKFLLHNAADTEKCSIIF